MMAICCYVCELASVGTAIRLCRHVVVYKLGYEPPEEEAELDAQVKIMNDELVCIFSGSMEIY